MSALSDRLALLPLEHRAVLEWFNARRGGLIRVPEPINGIHVFNPLKGIQKPKGWDYPATIRQTVSSSYDDHAPVTAADGSWTYNYFQEGLDADAAKAPTNRAMLNARDDDVPVVVLIQEPLNGYVQYRVWGSAKVVDYLDGHFHLQGYNDDGDLPAYATAPQDAPVYPSPSSTYSSTSTYPHVADVGSDVDHNKDARQRTLAEIVVRQGSGPFRHMALKIYGGRCAISGWAVDQVLEAAHIVPYLGLHTNTADNALLLRADLHTLFDLNRLTIDPETLQVRITPELRDTPYGQFHGVEIAKPQGVGGDALRDRLLSRIEVMANKTTVGL